MQVGEVFSIIPDRVKIDLYNNNLLKDGDDDIFYSSRPDIEKINYINSYWLRWINIIKRTKQPLFCEIEKQYKKYLRIKKLERICK